MGFLWLIDKGDNRLVEVWFIDKLCDLFMLVLLDNCYIFRLFRDGKDTGRGRNF